VFAAAFRSNKASCRKCGSALQLVLRISEGLAAVQIGKKWGYVDTAGKMAIELRDLSFAKPFTTVSLVWALARTAGAISIGQEEWCGTLRRPEKNELASRRISFRASECFVGESAVAIWLSLPIRSSDNLTADGGQ